MADEAKIVRIAKAVVAELVAGSFSQPVTVDRTYRPTRELADLADLRATVVPRGIELSSGSRGGPSDEYSVDIALRKKLAADGDAAADALMLVVEEVAAFFARRRMSAYDEAVWVRTENVPIFSAEHMEESALFISVVTVTFRVME